MNTSTQDVTAKVICKNKIKSEPNLLQETILDHYGKEGISWQGFLVQYYVKHCVPQDDGFEAKEPIKYTIYLNQVIIDGIKHDYLSVFALLDAAMSQIAQDLPIITHIILQTDNAKAYNNNFLLCGIYLLNYSTKDINTITF